MGPKGVYECTGDFGILRRGRNKQLHALFYHKVDKIYFPMHCDCATEVELKGQLKAAYPRWKKKMTEREAKEREILYHAELFIAKKIEDGDEADITTDTVIGYVSAFTIGGFRPDDHERSWFEAEVTRIHQARPSAQAMRDAEDSDAPAAGADTSANGDDSATAAATAAVAAAPSLSKRQRKQLHADIFGADDSCPSSDSDDDAAGDDDELVLESNDDGGGESGRASVISSDTALVPSSSGPSRIASSLGVTDEELEARREASERQRQGSIADNAAQLAALGLAPAAAPPTRKRKKRDAAYWAEQAGTRDRHYGDDGQRVQAETQPEERKRCSQCPFCGKRYSVPTWLDKHIKQCNAELLLGEDDLDDE